MMTIFMFALLVCGVFGDDVSVMEGDSVTLHTTFTDTKRDEIKWWFGPEGSSDFLVNIDGITPDITNDERFKDRLQILDIQNGDLIIKNMRKNHAGLYRVEIDGATGTFEKKFNVIVYDAPEEIDAGTDEVKSLSETIGDSVTLNTDVSLQRDALILWRFGHKGVLIAKDYMEDNKTPEYPDGLDGRFKGRLQVNNQTGDLAIRYLTYKDSGVYKLKMSNNKHIIHKTFSLSVIGVSGDEVKSVSVMEGDSVTLQTDITGTQRDEIKWWFGPEASSILLVHIDGSTDNIKYVEGFKDRLQISNIQNGDLIIKNMRKNHAGLYRAEIGGATGTVRKFIVVVYDAPGVLEAGTGEVKSVSETEGKSVTLHTDVNLQKDDLIVWRFGPKGALIAKDDVDDNKTPEYPDERLKGRLQVNDQTGDLIITNIRTEDSGDYKLKISSNNKTFYKTFSLSVRGGLSARYKVLIWILAILALAAALGAVLAALWFWYRRSQLKVQEIFVNEGESVTLHTDDIKGFRFRDVALIEWKYGDTGIIAEINRKDNTFPTYDGDDERFKNRLKLNNETGDLTIGDLKIKHSGLYQLKITRIKGWPSASYCQFNVVVTERIVQGNFGESVTLHTDVTDLQKDDLILWMVGAQDTHIAKFIFGTKDLVFYGYTDDRFNDRLQINPQTGDLTINNITPKHCGVYRVQICTNQRSTYRRFRVSILVQAEKGGSVGLKTGAQIQSGDRVEWNFRDPPSKRTSYDKITLVTGMNGDRNKTKYLNKKGRLDMNAKTGDLTITKIRETDEGVYTLQQRSTEGKITNWVFSVVFVSAINEPAAGVPLLNV